MPSCWSKSICDECNEIGHTWNSRCFSSYCDALIACVKFSLKAYTTLYSISFLVGRKGKEYFKHRLFQEIFQSSLFLSCNGVSFCMFFCFFRKLLGKFYMFSVGMLPGFFASLVSILVERKSRRGTLAIYMLNQACDTLFNILKASGYVKDVKFGEVVIFSVTMAIMMYMYRSGNLPDGFIKNLLRKCFEDKNNNSNTNNNEDTSGVSRSHSTNYVPENNITIMKNSIFLGGKVFFIGSSLHTLYYLVNSIPKLFKKPHELLHVVLRRDNFKFGAWLGSYACIYDSLLRFLEKYNKSGGHLNAAVAGGVAGVSMMWQRSSTYALYIASKTVELSYMGGIQKGVLPYFKHFDSLLYACCTAIMFHAAILQPLYLKSTYFKFLEGLTGEKFLTVNRERLNEFGYDSTRIDRILQAKSLLTPLDK